MNLYKKKRRFVETIIYKFDYINTDPKTILLKYKLDFELCYKKII